MKRAFTQPTDRAIAFTGLEKRLAKAFYSDVHYGIMGKFLHRNLLWLRTADTTLTKTHPGPHDSQTERTPSWSWMAYEGSMEFMSIRFENVAWSNALKFRNTKELECHVREIKDYSIMRKGDEYVLVSTQGNNGSSEASSNARSSGVEDLDLYESRTPRSWLRFDVDTSDVKSLKCVVVGRQFGYYSNEYQQDCYILVVKPSNHSSKMFERVGAGSLESKFISFGELDIRASVI